MNINSKTYAVAASTISASVTIGNEYLNKLFIRIANPTTAVAYVRSSLGASTALTTDFVVMPGESIVVEKNLPHDTLSVILTAGTGNIYFSII